ncbi:MAG TPA: GGDEF domain-containing protein [Kineosporiaceae bacterium]|nr:GGDEF domain-containing protein [Kineosporiaceae bacterium]
MTASDAYPELRYPPLVTRLPDRLADRHLASLPNSPVEPADHAEPSSRIGLDWVVRAQDGEASQVLAEIDLAIRTGLAPRTYARALYAQALCLMMLNEGSTAVRVARELSTLCRDLKLPAAGLQARALLVDLLRREGQLEQAVEQLAHAVALEPALRDLSDPDTQTALGALAIALRHSGTVEEANRLEQRLAAVEHTLPLHQRVSRWSNLAFEHVAQAMSAARRAPYHVDADLLDQAVTEIEMAAKLASDGPYQVIAIEAQVIAALPAAVVGNAEAGLADLNKCREVQELGPEATSAQLFWAVGMVRALVRLGCFHEAAAVGVRMLSRIRDHGREGDRRILAYEVMRAEHPQVERALTGTAEYLALTEERVGTGFALVSALFKARVDLLRGADERRGLARAASLDPLTGLINRRGAAAAIADAAARPRNESIALLVIDLDGFKDVNDNSGHLAGDVVLQRVSQALRATARLEDMVARWGGDEFVVVATLDEDRALALADRLRDTIRQRAEVDAGTPVTGSVGVAVRETPVDEVAWLQRADEAMYLAKRSGGDATVLG